MDRRDLLTSALGGAAAALLAPSAWAATRRPPNFIVIQCDDMGYGDWGAAAKGAIRTPNLDRMARQGTTMTDFYAGANVCTPSRAAMLTGRYAVSHRPWPSRHHAQRQARPAHERKDE